MLYFNSNFNFIECKNVICTTGQKYNKLLTFKNGY
jgi:hypothetical protein